MAPDRETAEALAQKYHDPGAAARTFALAFDARAERAAPPRHLERRGACCSSGWPRACSTPTARCARRAGRARAPTRSGQAGLWPHGISGDLPILLVRVVGDDDLPLVRQVLQAQEYWRLKGLQRRRRDPQRAPVELPRRDAGAARRRCSTTGPWRTWKHRPGGAYLLRGDRMGQAERVLLEAVARAVLRGDRGDLAHAARPPDPRAAAGAAPLGRARRRATRRHAVDRADVAVPAADARQRPRRLRRRRPRVRDRARGRPRRRRCRGRTSSPTRSFGTVVTASGSAHTWCGEQPREPADAVRQRPGQRSHGRGDLRPRRRDRRGVVADAGPAAAATARAGRCVVRHARRR